MRKCKILSSGVKYVMMCLLELVQYSIGTSKLDMLWLHMKLIYLGICGGLGVGKLQVHCTEH